MYRNCHLFKGKVVYKTKIFSFVSLQTTVTADANKLTFDQKGDPPTTIIREFTADSMKLVSWQTFQLISNHINLNIYKTHSIEINMFK